MRERDGEFVGDVFQIGLGSRVTDKITGMSGIVTARAEHLYGCARYWVQPESLKDGKPAEGAWLDEHALDVVAVDVHRPYNVVISAPEAVKAVAVADRVTRQPVARAGGFDLPSSH